MAAHTDDEFEQALVDDFGWRRLELAHLKKLLSDAERRSASSPATRGLSRAMVAMCYAHWEGYSKNALDHYARLVTRRRPRISEARDGLAVEHAIRLLKRISSGDAHAKEVLATALRGGSDERINLDRSILSDTKSNLRFDTLQGLFARGCIPIDDFELKANLIDKLLCDRRNDVAHGRALFVPPAESLSLCEQVLELMADMQSVLVTQVRAKRYLNEASTIPSPATAT